jgi:hypothetical protein
MAASFPELETEAARRWSEISASGRPWVRVGTALCGQAAGGEEVADALREAVKRHGADALVTEVGCLGLCFAEPLVDVQFPGGARVFTATSPPNPPTRSWPVTWPAALR